MPVCHLSTPQISYDGGYEIATFEVNVVTIKRLMSYDSEFSVHYALSNLYLGVLKINPVYDIAHVKTQRISGSQYKITLKIRRGWWFLREFMLKHQDIAVENKDGIVKFSCADCGEEEFYQADAFPRSKHEVEDSCIRGDSSDSETSQGDGEASTGHHRPGSSQCEA